VHLASKEKINPEAVKYLNRLSDWFFVAARFENKSISGDALWIPGSNR
jgi:cob(I)alamin adenosyltransferase